jgi:hypothetical protein
MSAPILQQGGVVSSIQLLIANIDSPIKLLYGLSLILLIVYSSVIPSIYRKFANSLLGRVFGIGLIYGVTESLGWVYGLLTGMAFLLLLLNSSDPISNEGFYSGGGTVTEKKRIGKRWFVEKVLGETPFKIATDKVTTSAIQD